MKFLSLAYLATGVAASVVRRDLATITGVLNTIGTDLDGLTTATQNFNGDTAGILDASNKAIQDLKDGDATIQAQPALSLNDAIGLTGPAQNLQTKGDALLAAIKDKKPAIAAAGLCQITLTQVTDLKTASDALIKTVVSKVPAAAQSIAQGLVDPLQKDLAAAVDLFSAANCVNSGGSSSTAPPTTAPTSTNPPATSTAPATTTPPATTSVPTVPATTETTSEPTTTAPGPGNGTCPAASTVTVTSTDTKDCTPTPTCTKTPPVTITKTTKACPTGSKLPW